ncbi:DUF6973 domain-containing protein [Paenibacillus herberti]|uniref:DUF6973 domain-containing protein n=1 Tax=Paenibacillus herberti TaxID=1619309 RepID=A0A229NY42_9BACL|nr:hypothetical protein [Paenibacillus herberti]OXM14671.1 hypothetical protein CGZ75_17320 [Paenibacillus herberti]
MKKRSLVASIAITTMLFVSTGTVFATDSTQKSTSVSGSAQEIVEQYPVYSMSVYEQIVEEVGQGLLTTDEQAGDIHEEHNPGTALANEMDVWNNAAGILIYTNHTGSTTESALITLIKTYLNIGNFKYIKNGFIAWTNA